MVISVLAVPLGRADDLEEAWNAIRPVIYAKNDMVAAMKSAPLIVVARIEDVKLSVEQRQVYKPSGVGGPMTPTIPLCLARMSAKALLTIRGDEAPRLEVYSWVWDSGKHGGPRLFNPTPDSVHIFFLKKEDSGYLRTAGDYPASDVEIASRLADDFVSYWNGGYSKSTPLMGRIVAVLLKVELENLDEQQDSRYWLDARDFVELASPPFVAGQLNQLCQNLANPLGRRRACAASLDSRR